VLTLRFSVDRANIYDRFLPGIGDALISQSGDSEDNQNDSNHEGRFHAPVASEYASPAPDEVEYENYQRDHKQEMNEAASKMKSKSAAPKNQ